MNHVGQLPRVNPFSTRFVQPGAIPFRFPSPEDRTRLLQRLAETGRGEIIGPHGSGKSTLLASLLPALGPWRVKHVRLNTSERCLPRNLFDELEPQTLLVIDGFEQLGMLTRWRVKRRCRRNDCGLLITAHTPMGLPELWRTDVNFAMASELIASLLPPGGEWVLAGFDIAERLRIHRGSLREVLFELYDRWSAAS